MARRFGFLLERLVAAMSAIGTLLVLFIMGTILVDVGGRYLLNRPLAGTAELVVMSITTIVFLQFPGTLAAGRVIATDGFDQWLAARSIRASQWLLGAHHLVGALLFAAVCTYVVPLARVAWQTGHFYGAPSVFTFPKWPVLWVVAFGCGVMALQYLALALRFFDAGRRRVRLFEIDPTTKVLS